MAGGTRRTSRPAVVLRWLAVAVVCAIAVAYVQPVRAYLSARDEVAKRELRKHALLRRQAELRHALERTGTDDFVVREARRLGLVRPGERLFIVSGIEQWLETRLP